MYGAIVNVSSGATFGILPGASAYTSSKTALNNCLTWHGLSWRKLELSSQRSIHSSPIPSSMARLKKRQDAAEVEISNIGEAAHSPERVAEKILGLIQTGERQDDLVPKEYGGSLDT